MNASYLQLQYFWTCSCVLVTFSMLLTETSETPKVWLFCTCPGLILTTDWAKLIKNYIIISICMESRIVHFYFFRFRLIYRYFRTNKPLNIEFRYASHGASRYKTDYRLVCVLLFILLCEIILEDNRHSTHGRTVGYLPIWFHAGMDQAQAVFPSHQHL